MDFLPFEEKLIWLKKVIVGFFAILRTVLVLKKNTKYIKYTRISILSICKWILENSGCGLGYLNLIQAVFPWILKYFCLIFHY